MVSFEICLFWGFQNLTFGQLEAEKIEVTDTKGHFHFSHEYVRNYPISAIVITVLDLQNLHWTCCITFSNNFHTNNTGFNQKEQRYWFLKILFWNYSEKWLKMTWKCENWKWPLVCSNLNISASTLPTFKIKDSYEILRTSRFQKCPSFLNLMKVWGNYRQNTNWHLFSWTPCSTDGQH